MIIDIEERDLRILSDLHLGSPASTAGTRVTSFLDRAIDEGWSLCINGDGFDVLQSSLPTFLAAAAPFLRRLRRLAEVGRPVYYTIGNHDIVLEHMLDGLPMTVAPFLNLRSGSKRIRIEHGHLHEPFYARHPRLYELGGRFGRSFLLRNADFYRIWSWSQLQLDRRRRRLIDGCSRYPHYEAADALFQRGFDAVVFGHTHIPELTELDRGLFVNAGSWMHGADVVRITDGAIEIQSWTP